MLRLLTFLTIIISSAPTALGQLLDEAPVAGPDRYGEPVTGEFRVGAVVTASRGAVRNIRAMVAVPFDCEEQTVRIVDEEFTSEVASVKYRDVPGGEARQMLITIPYLPNRAEARAVVTFDVTTRPILPPDDERAATLKVPDRVPRDLRRYTSVSPLIEARDRKIRSIARDEMEKLGEDANDWRRIEALYDYVLDNIKYVEGPDTSAEQTLREGYADCHGRSALFVALCRSADIPARVVWVQGHCYAEFYLEDETGAGHWYPIESAGSRAFGEMPLGRVILQKGDNFRVPERPKDRLFYATDFMVGLPEKGSGKPRVKYIRESL